MWWLYWCCMHSAINLNKIKKAEKYCCKTKSEIKIHMVYVWATFTSNESKLPGFWGFSGIYSWIPLGTLLFWSFSILPQNSYYNVAGSIIAAKISEFVVSRSKMNPNIVCYSLKQQVENEHMFFLWSFQLMDGNQWEILYFQMCSQMDGFHNSIGNRLNLKLDLCCLVDALASFTSV